MALQSDVHGLKQRRAGEPPTGADGGWWGQRCGTSLARAHGTTRLTGVRAVHDALLEPNFMRPSGSACYGKSPHDWPRSRRLAGIEVARVAFREGGCLRQTIVGHRSHFENCVAYATIVCASNDCVTIPLGANTHGDQRSSLHGRRARPPHCSHAHQYEVESACRGHTRHHTTSRWSRAEHLIQAGVRVTTGSEEGVFQRCEPPCGRNTTTDRASGADRERSFSSSCPPNESARRDLNPVAVWRPGLNRFKRLCGR